MRSPRITAALLLSVPLLATASIGSDGRQDPADPLAPLLEQLQQVRRRAGLGPLTRRAVLDSAALLRARAIADRSSDAPVVSDPGLMSAALEQAGAGLYRRAAEHIDLRQYRGDPVVPFLNTWTTEALTLEPGLTAVGLGLVADADGYATLVAILLEDVTAPTDLERVEQRVFDEINRVRRRNGLRRLRWDDELAVVARAHSADMARRSYFNHVSPDGVDPADRTTAAGIGFARIAENIEYNRNAPDPVLKAVQDWWDSPGHRANILEAGFTRTGIGVAVDDAAGLYFTQLFMVPGTAPAFAALDRDE